MYRVGKVRNLDFLTDSFRQNELLVPVLEELISIFQKIVFSHFIKTKLWDWFTQMLN
jgi:hypothetical protein